MQSTVTIEHLIDYLSAPSDHVINPPKKIEEEKEDDGPFIGDNIRALKLNETDPSTKFPEFFRTVFKAYKDQVYRCGILKEDIHNKKQINISLLCSVLFCIKDEFSSMKQSEQFVFVHSVKEKLLYGIAHDKIFMKYNYKKLGWTKQILMQELKNFSNNSIVLRYICDYFDINIFLFNFDDEKIYLIYPESRFNKYKVNVFLACVDKNFEPILFNKNKYWSYNTQPLIDLIENYAENFMIVTTDLSKNQTEKVFIMADSCLEEEPDEEEVPEKETKDEIEVSDEDKEEKEKEEKEDTQTEAEIMYSNKEKKVKKHRSKKLKKAMRV